LNQSELENKTIAELRTIAKGLNVKSPTTIKRLN
jgi:Mn-dependent DtxR family transcriptional regulator